MQVHHHHNPSLNGDSEESYVTPPHSDAEVIAQQVLKQKTAGECIDGRKDQDQRFRYRVENHIEQKKNYKEHHRQNQFQPLLCTKLKLVLAGPLKRITRS